MILIAGAVLLLALFLTLYPTAMLIRGSLSVGKLANPGSLTLSNYLLVYGQLDTYGLFATTLLYAVAVAAFSVVVGLALAWIAVRSDAPLARHMSWLIFIPYALPSTLLAIAWTLLANPTNGVLNNLLADVSHGLLGPVSIYSFGGMVFVASTYSCSLAFTFFAVAIRALDPTLDEAASISGAGLLGRLWRVTLPLLRPVIVSVFALLVILGLESFDIPAFIGIPAKIYVFTTQVFIQTSVKTPPDYGRAATYGILPLILALGLTVYYQRTIASPDRYAVVSGKAYRPHRVSLGPWRWVATTLFLLYFVVVAVLPVATVVVISFAPSLIAARNLDIHSFGLANYAAMLQDEISVRAMKNTLVLAILGATVAMAGTFLLSWVITRSRLRGRGIVEYLLFLPFAFPSIVLAVGVLWGYVNFPIDVYGTIWILLLGYVTKFLPYGLRTMNTAFLQVHRSLEEAAQISGAGLGQIFRRILLPLVLPSLVAGWSLLVVVFMREFSISLMLWASGSEVVSVLFWDDWTNGRYGQLGAMGTLLIAASLLLVFGVRRITRVQAVLD